MTLTIHDLADRIARWRALDLALFETCGRWTVDTDDGAIAAFWAAVAHQHAWHAELWAARFPLIAGLDLDEATGRARSGLAAGAVEALGDAATTTDRLTVVGTAVLAGHAAEVEGVASATDPDLDAPTHRVLTLVLADVRSEIDAAARLRR